MRAGDWGSGACHDIENTSVLPRVRGVDVDARLRPREKRSESRNLLMLRCARAPWQDLTKGDQVSLANTQEPSIAHRGEAPGANPLLHSTRGDFQQLGYFFGRIQTPYLCGLWQYRLLFPCWHTQPRLLKVVSLGRTSLNLTEKLCILKWYLRIPQFYNFRQ